MFLHGNVTWNFTHLLKANHQCFKGPRKHIYCEEQEVCKGVYRTTHFFYKLHFYKQRKAEIGKN